MLLSISFVAGCGGGGGESVPRLDLREYAERAMRHLLPIVEEESLFGGAIRFVRSEVGNRNSGGTQLDDVMVFADMDYTTGITGFDVFQGVDAETDCTLPYRFRFAKRPDGSLAPIGPGYRPVRVQAFFGAGGLSTSVGPRGDAYLFADADRQFYACKRERNGGAASVDPELDLEMAYVPNFIEGSRIVLHGSPNDFRFVEASVCTPKMINEFPDRDATPPLEDCVAHDDNGDGRPDWARWDGTAIVQATVDHADLVAFVRNRKPQEVSTAIDYLGSEDRADRTPPAVPGGLQIQNSGHSGFTAQAVDPAGNLYLVFNDQSREGACRSAGCEVVGGSETGRSCLIKFDRRGRCVAASRFGSLVPFEGGGEAAWKLVHSEGSLFVVGGTTAYGDAFVPVGPLGGTGGAVAGYVSRFDAETLVETARRQYPPPSKFGVLWNVTTDAEGAVYVSGARSCEVPRGVDLPAGRSCGATNRPAPFPEETDVRMPGDSPYVAKLTRDLDLIWERTIVDPLPVGTVSGELQSTNEAIAGIAVHGGSLWLAGYSTVGDFLGGSVTNNDNWVAKFDAGTGELEFGFAFGAGSDEDYIWDLATDAEGNAYVVGGVDGEIDRAHPVIFGYGPAGGYLTGLDPLAGVARIGRPAGESDVVIVKIRPDGSIPWIHTFGSARSDQAHGVEIHGDRLYVSGVTRGFLPGFGDGEPARSWDFDAWVARLDVDGEGLVGRQWGSQGVEFNFSKLRVDSRSGSVFYSGMTNGNVSGGGGRGFDAFVTKLDGETLEFLPFRPDEDREGAAGVDPEIPTGLPGGAAAGPVFLPGFIASCRRSFRRRGSPGRSGACPALVALATVVGSCAGILLACSSEEEPRIVERLEIGAVLRTPDERFDGIPDYPFRPNYVQAGRVRIHYLDEGPREGPVVVLLHGQPSWSFLYRKMIPPLAAAGFRVIVPDLVGFGRSDKPVERSDYTYERHTLWMQHLLEEHLDLRGVTMFLQDWGGLIGLRLAAASPERYDRIVLANTGLPAGEGEATPAFLAFRDFVGSAPVLPVGAMIGASTRGRLSAAEIAAYDAPFPDESFKGGARSFPFLVPIEPENPGVPAALATWAALERWQGPVVTAFSDGDPVTRGFDTVFQARIPGARGQAHVTIPGAGHFLQEDASAELARVIVSFVEANPGTLPQGRGG